MRGVGARGDGDIGGSGASRRGERTEKGALPPPFSPSPGLFLNSLCPHPAVPSVPILWAYILGIKGIVAATAELVAALGAVKVHAASSGQCVRELALGAVCKGQRVRAGTATVLQALRKRAAGKEIYRANRQPHLCHFPEGTSPSPGPGTPGHWCVSSSGNLHSSGLGAAPPTAGRKDASHKSAIPGPSCWSLHSDPVLPGLVHGTAFHHLLKSQTKGPALALISTPHPFTIKSGCHPSLAQPCPLFFIRTMTTLL